jgi:hypothetical protein
MKMSDGAFSAKTRIRSIAPACVFAGLLSLPSARASGQMDARSVSNEIVLTLEPVAVGAGYARAVGERASVGLVIGAGPLYTVSVSDDGAEDVREWATGHAIAGYRSAGGIEVLAGPGATILIGNDFGAIYPSALAGFGYRRGRVRLATVLRTVRIAGGNGTGIYRMRWTPLQLGWVIPL